MPPTNIPSIPRTISVTPSDLTKAIEEGSPTADNADFVVEGTNTFATPLMRRTSQTTKKIPVTIRVTYNKVRISHYRKSFS